MQRPGWYPDPSRRHTLRWWDGGAWASYASSRPGEVVEDPLPRGEPPTPVAAALDGAGEPAVRPGAAAGALVAKARTLRAAVGDALEAPEVRRRGARRAFEAVRDDIVQQQIWAVPIARLRETTEGRLRLGPIESAGYRTVGAAAAAGRYRLECLQGVGPQTAAQVIAAAHHLGAAMREGVRVRFDPDRRPPLHTDLLGALHLYQVAEQAVSPIRPQSEELAVALDRVLADAARAASRLKLVFTGRRRRGEVRSALEALDAIMRSPATTLLEPKLRDVLASLERERPPVALWHDYERRAVTYNGLLIEVGELGPDLNAVHGFVPAGIAVKVQDQPLDTSLLDVSLRGYQAFGAKFALVQRKAILGDEMGLGKTIEALAAMSHLRSDGETHFLVVCPASVLVNWAHEVARHSRLQPHRLHGAERGYHLKVWARRGGVGITTYDSLRSLPISEGVRIAMLVVDEAHYVQNPTALRTRAVRRWVGETPRTLFLTGTPMENRVEEFRTLVGHLQPAVAARISAMDGLAGATAFRSAVAPVYLRRNQSDVLEELPPRIETEEWVQLEGDDLAAYREAVASGNFMAMRRAAYAPGRPDGSAKLARLADIVDEAASNGRKVVVFSFFRDVLDHVGSMLDDLATGPPITGGVAPAARQALIDEFTARSGPAVLVSQIDAGGVGLNIQAASVVILTEPQWKPTIEDQAVARCHRMGQVRPVDVHRLLAEDSVDQRMIEILATKAVLFDEYVRRSELKEISPDAVDISDVNTTKAVVTQAEMERRIVDMERKRLGLDRQASLTESTGAEDRPSDGL